METEDNDSQFQIQNMTGKLAAMSAFMARKIKFDGNLKLLGVLTAAQD